MNLRSRASAAKGKAKVYKEIETDNDDDFGDSSSSDATFVTGGVGEDEDEEIFDVLEEDSDASDPELLFRNDEIAHSPPKRRKRNSLKSKGEPSNVVPDEADGEGEGEINGYVGTERADVTPVISNNNNNKKKKGKKKRADKPVLCWEVMERENEIWIAENSNKDIDLENQNDIVAETAEASDDLIIPLLRYQKEWLAWALKQEESSVRGGILADEMGMGKTLQAIALVLFKRKMLREISGHDLPSSSSCSSMQLPSIKGTLVICPLVAVMQWVGEIQKFTAEGSTKVLIYHGANRAKNHYQFSDYDFVITTYSIVEAEYRKYVMPPKEKCNYCGKLFYEHKLKIHLKYFCGPSAEKTSKQLKQQKKEIKPKKMLDSSKKRSAKVRKEYELGDEDMDIGCSSENPVVTDRTSFEGKSILHSLFWNRVILDEAHYIKERRSNTTRAVLALQSSYKWALSGTPLQNRVGELYSLVRFLQIVPYSYYFCKDCDCRTLDYSTTPECPCCAHKSVRHFCWWNRNISSPIQDAGKSGFGRDAMLLLKHKILKSILLRRTKKGRAADLALPPRIVTLRRDILDVVEEDYYTALYNESQAQFNTYIEAGTMSNNYAHIFDLLTRLRQAVDHPYLVEYSLTSMERKGKIVDIGDDVKCCLCHELAEDAVVTSCEHAFCKSCLIDFGATSGQNSCPECNKALTVDFTTNMNGKKQISRTTIKGFKAKSILNRLQLDNFQTSTKIDALREEIRGMVERDGSAKGIVFSQFASFLDLIHYSLQKSGINCVQLDGSMTMGARDAAITKFTEDAHCKVFLMSLKAGGVALNLTVASQVFLMDPWWNPAVERQAQDRIHRIGQYKPIRIVRFVIENTIEERILKLQEKKELVFEGTVGGSSEALTKLTEADLRFLFC